MRRREQTYCMDAQGPGSRPPRCTPDDPSERRIQISPVTHRAGVSFTEVVVGITGSCPAPKSSVFQLPTTTSQRGLLLALYATLAMDLDFQNKVKKKKKKKGTI